MINLNLHNVGVDFYAGSGHKWQCGPGQTGMAYIRNGVSGTPTAWTMAADGVTRSGNSPAYASTKPLPRFWVTSGTYITTASGTGGGRTPWAGGNRSHTFDMANAMMTGGATGSNSTMISKAIAETHALWDAIGRTQIENYIVYLAQRLRTHFANAPMFTGLGELVAGRNPDHRWGRRILIRPHWLPMRYSLMLRILTIAGSMRTVQTAIFKTVCTVCRWIRVGPISLVRREVRASVTLRMLCLVWLEMITIGHSIR
jgi:hypothetical protein